jgi:hypothetical protein
MQPIQTRRDFMTSKKLTPEEEAEYIRQEFENAPKEELEELMKQDEILKMLAQPDIKDYGYYKFGEVTIRHKKFMTKKLRRILSISERKVKTSDDPLGTQDEAVYAALAEICVDAPWTDPNSWKLVDLKTSDGRIYSIFKAIVKSFSENEKEVKTFRAK